MVGYKPVIINVEVKELTYAFIGCTLQNLILFGSIVLSKADIKAHNIRVKITFGLKGNVFIATLRVPIGEAVAKGIMSTAFYEKCSVELIAITEIIEICMTFIDKTATCLVVFVFAIV